MTVTAVTVTPIRRCNGDGSHSDALIEPLLRLRCELRQIRQFPTPARSTQIADGHDPFPLLVSADRAFVVGLIEGDPDIPGGSVNLSFDYDLPGPMRTPTSDAHNRSCHVVVGSLLGPERLGSREKHGFIFS